MKQWSNEVLLLLEVYINQIKKENSGVGSSE